MRAFDFNGLAYGIGQPLATALFKQQPEDFVVTEQLQPTATEQGEHLWAEVRKRGQNTHWVAAQLAQQADVDPSQVGYAGLKDRHAVTTQWFSLTLPRGDVALADGEGFSVLRQIRQPRKLRRGDHTGNHFTLRLREFDGDRAATQQRLAEIAEHGVPNYFGEQRFGLEMGNLREVERRVADGELRGDRRQRGRNRNRKSDPKAGLYLSAARSWLFNWVLSARVDDGTWTQALGEGDDLTGPLWGRGRSAAVAEARAYEAELLAPFADWCDALEHAGLQQERRPLRLLPIDLSSRWQGDDLILDFALATGQFATVLLRELVQLKSSPVL